MSRRTGELEENRRTRGEGDNRRRKGNMRRSGEHKEKGRPGGEGVNWRRRGEQNGKRRT